MTLLYNFHHTKCEIKYDVLNFFTEVMVISYLHKKKYFDLVHFSAFLVVFLENSFFGNLNAWKFSESSSKQLILFELMGKNIFGKDLFLFIISFQIFYFFYASIENCGQFLVYFFIVKKHFLSYDRSPFNILIVFR